MIAKIPFKTSCPLASVFKTNNRICNQCSFGKALNAGFGKEKTETASCKTSLFSHPSDEVTVNATSKVSKSLLKF